MDLAPLVLMKTVLRVDIHPPIAGQDRTGFWVQAKRYSSGRIIEFVRANVASGSRIVVIPNHSHFTCRAGKEGIGFQQYCIWQRSGLETEI